jgi:glucokinase
MILAGDLGGTKTNLAYFIQKGDSLDLEMVKSYPSREYKALGDIVTQMRKSHPSDITAAAFGIAGPVFHGKSRITNLGWEVDARELASLLGLPAVGLLNDLEATAYGTLRLKRNDSVVLNPGIPQAHGAIAVIAAGTGLGEGGLIWDGARYRALPSEGGHTDFAPRTELEMDLLRYLLRKHKHVSYERLISGPGLYGMYQFFRLLTDHPEPEWLREQLSSADPSAAVSQAGLDKKDTACERALDMFVTLYGAEAGNLALKLLATGGVYIGGGIAPKILPKLHERYFLEAFFGKGRYEEFMKKLPVSVIVNDKTALLGAAHYAVTML